MKKLIYILFFLVGVVNAQQLAFPTATGAGAYVTGGRGKPVYIVTNLNDSGAGSLRQILEDTKSTNGGQIVFNVSGVVNLSSNLFASGVKNITISGQTAPEGGIAVGNYPMGFYASSGGTIPSENIIIRYIKVRPDSFSRLPSQIDVLDMQYTIGYIIDHCSLSFGTDEAPHHGWYEDFTWQNNLIAESSKGMIMGQVDRGEGNFSFNKNIIYNTSHRFPNIESDGRVDLINNIVWSFHSRMSRPRGTYSLNQIGNYYVCDPNDDPANPDRRWNHIQSGTWGYPTGVYTNENYFFDGNNIILDGNSANDDYASLWFDDISSTPLPAQYEAGSPYTQLGESFTPLTAAETKSQLPDDCGAVKRLGADGSVISDIDTLDTIYINNIKTNTHTGWIYTGDQTDNPPKINDNNSSTHYDTFQATVTGTPINTHPGSYDTDNDGMPDVWENATFGDLTRDGTLDFDSDGYTDLEEFLNLVDGVAQAQIVPQGKRRGSQMMLIQQ
jgi:hypothetical protein